MKKGLGLLILAVGIVCVGNVAFAKDGYTIVPVPDTIVQKTPLDTAIYNNTAEFFTPYIVNEINKTQFMNAPTVTDVRSKIQRDYWLTKTTTKAMDDFRRFYKLDFEFAKKIAKLYDTNLVLLVTSATDSTNYITRRTWWDFFNIAGASVLDPAYKINIYAVLIDTEKDLIVWNKSYQKTISVVENRIVATGYAPQTEQLQKIKDYSVYLAPRVARSLQETLLTPTQKAVEANLIHTDYGSIDNVFTKKYRTLRQETVDATVIPAAKAREGYGIAKEKYNETKEVIQTKLEERKQQRELQNSDGGIEFIKFFKKNPTVEQSTVQPVVPAVIVTPIAGSVQAAKEAVVDVVEQTTAVSAQTAEKVKEAVKEVKDTVKEVNIVPSVATPEVLSQPSAQQVSTPVEPKKEITNISSKPKTTSSTESVSNNIVKQEVKPKELKTDKDIDKKSQALLQKAFKNKPIDREELPVDSLIYTQPSEYLPSTNYLPIKPRLREINTNDTYNAF